MTRWDRAVLIAVTQLGECTIDEIRGHIKAAGARRCLPSVAAVAPSILRLKLQQRIVSEDTVEGAVYRLKIF